MFVVLFTRRNFTSALKYLLPAKCLGSLLHKLFEAFIQKAPSVLLQSSENKKNIRDDEVSAYC